MWKIVLKVRISELLFTKTPFKTMEAQPQTSLEKFCTNPDGKRAFCKRKMAESAKNHPPFLRGRGGGGRYMGRTQPSNLKLLHFYIYIFST